MRDLLLNRNEMDGRRGEFEPIEAADRAKGSVSNAAWGAYL